MKLPIYSCCGRWGVMYGRLMNMLYEVSRLCVVDILCICVTAGLIDGYVRIVITGRDGR